MTNTIATSTVSTNSGGKKVRYKIGCYIQHTVLFVIILLLTIAIIFCHYTKHGSKQKGIDVLKGSITYIFSNKFAKKTKLILMILCLRKKY